MLGTVNGYGQSAMEFSTDSLLFKAKLHIVTPRTSSGFQVIISKLVQMSLTIPDTIKEYIENKQTSKHRNKDTFFINPKERI